MRIVIFGLAVTSPWGNGPSGRPFEAAACGVSPRSDTWPELEAFFTPGREILVAHDTADALAAIDLPLAGGDTARCGPCAGIDFDDDYLVQARFAAEVAGLDPTNWWVPNRACTEAMLRSAGLDIMSRPEEETYLCRRTPHHDPAYGAIYPARGEHA